MKLNLSNLLQQKKEIEAAIAAAQAETEKTAKLAAWFSACACAIVSAGLDVFAQLAQKTETCSACKDKEACADYCKEAFAAAPVQHVSTSMRLPNASTFNNNDTAAQRIAQRLLESPCSRVRMIAAGKPMTKREVVMYEHIRKNFACGEPISLSSVINVFMTELGYGSTNSEAADSLWLRAKLNRKSGATKKEAVYYLPVPEKTIAAHAQGTSAAALAQPETSGYTAAQAAADKAAAQQPKAAAARK